MTNKLTATSKLACILNVSHTTDNSHKKGYNDLITVTNPQSWDIYRVLSQTIHHGISRWYSISSLYSDFLVLYKVTFILSYPGGRSPCSQLPIEKQWLSTPLQLVIDLPVWLTADVNYGSRGKPLTCLNPGGQKSYSKCPVWVLMPQIKNRQSCESGAPYLEMFPHATPPSSRLFFDLEKAHDTTWWYSILNGNLQVGYHCSRDHNANIFRRIMISSHYISYRLSLNRSIHPTQACVQDNEDPTSHNCLFCFRSSA
jgi:hypothetical protein